MRTIKFRGKSLQTGEWVFGYYVNQNGVPYIIVEKESDSRFVHRVDPETVGEFTGKLDKTGINEIYEGDIVKCYPWPDDTEQNVNRKAVIIWNTGDFSKGDCNPNGYYCLYGYKQQHLNPLDDNSYGKASTLDNDFVEVIGNVIDDKGLLEGI